MAFGTPASLGTVDDKTAGTTIALTVTDGASVGDLVVVAAAFDNEGTSDVETSQLSIADSEGNTWTKVREQTESAGAADDGVTAAWFFSVLTSALTSGVSTITVTSSSSRTASALVAAKLTIGAGNTVEQADGTSEAVVNAASGQPGSISTTGMTSEEHLHLLAFALEGASSITVSAWDTLTALLSDGTTGGAGTSNISVHTGYHIGTNTGLAADITASTGSQHVQILVALREVAGAGGGDVSAAGAIATAEAHGIGRLIRLLENAGTVTSGEAFGASRANRMLRNAGQIASVEQLGTPGQRRLLRPDGLGSGEAFGSGRTVRVLRAAGITTGALLGEPKTMRLLRAVGVIPGLEELRDRTNFSTANWTGYFVKPAITTGIADPFGGTQACEMASADGTLNYSGLVQDATSVGTRLIRGAQYEVRAWLRVTSTTLAMNLGLTDGAHSAITVDTTWTEFVKQITLQNAPSQPQRLFQVTENTAANPVWQMYAPSVRRITPGVSLPGQRRIMRPGGVASLEAFGEPHTIGGVVFTVDELTDARTAQGLLTDLGLTTGEIADVVALAADLATAAATTGDLAAAYLTDSGLTIVICSDQLVDDLATLAAVADID